MPTINNETVIGSGYVTYRNARPQLLSNGWVVTAVYSSSATRLQFRVKKTAAGAWEDLTFLTTSNVLSWSLAVKGTRVFATLHTSSSNATSFLNFDATTVSSSTTLPAAAIDNTSTSGAFSGEDLAINDAGTELHHAFSAKTPTYPNSFNIRYLKGTIAADGSVTWSAVEQITKTNTTGYYSQNPTLLIYSNSPVIISDSKDSVYFFLILKQSGLPNAPTSNNAWSWNILSSSSFPQGNPNGQFIPRSINGLANGRMWVTWHGKDTTDSAKFNIRTSFSDDGGVTWATPTKQTSGNLYDQMNPSLTADKNGKVLLYWDGDEDASGNTVTVTKEKIFNGTWGATTNISGDNHYGVSTLFDRTFSLYMNRAPFIRYYASGVRFNGTYFAGASVSPLSSALGNKETSSVLSYTITPESGSTITSIVEKVNGTTVNTFSNPASLSRTFTIPLANWDALKYYNTHTISVTVTDSNGMANTQTYTFNKTLANDASLLEGAKAAKDGKDRVSQKREIIAGQVGAPPGSTFDAISAAIDSRNVVKRQSGTATVSGGSITISTLTFLPKSIMIRASATQIGQYNADMAINENRNGTTITSNAFSNITSSGFTAAISGTSVTWEAWN